MSSSSSRPADQSLLDTCRSRSIELLKRNLTADGILAASPGPRARQRGYTAIFGRDAAVCAIGMAVSGDPALERAAAAGLHTLALHQAPNGQIAKFVDLQKDEPDFWYLGCIDSTLWWLMALALLDRFRGGSTLRRPKLNAQDAESSSRIVLDLELHFRRPPQLRGPADDSNL